MPLTTTELVINILLLCLIGTVISVMINRKLYPKFPLFFSFMIMTGVSCVASTAIYVYAHDLYFGVYWTCSTLMMLVGFGVMYEVFVTILKPFSAVIDLGKMLFGWAALFLLLAAFLTAMVTTGPSPSRIVMACDLLDRCVHMMQCGMLMLLVFFERRLNFSWKSSAMSIGMGIGLLGAGDLIISYADRKLPSMAADFSIAYSLGFVALLGFWSFALQSSAKARNVVPESPSRLILQRWNEALTGYGYGDVAYASNATDSFLPNVERTVDRVMARKIVK
jgi:hypothetical protein